MPHSPTIAFLRSFDPKSLGQDPDLVKKNAWIKEYFLVRKGFDREEFGIWYLNVNDTGDPRASLDEFNDGFKKFLQRMLPKAFSFVGLEFETKNHVDAPLTRSVLKALRLGQRIPIFSPIYKEDGAFCNYEIFDE